MIRTDYESILGLLTDADQPIGEKMQNASRSIGALIIAVDYLLEIDAIKNRIAPVIA